MPDSQYTPTLDGQVQRIDSEAPTTWEEIHEGDGTHPNDDAISFAAWEQRGSYWSRIARGILVFDISAVAGRTIRGAELDLIPILVSDAFDESIVLVDAVPASDDEIVAADYQTAFAFEKQSDEIGISAMTEESPFMLTLNAVGLATVQAAMDSDGILRLGFVCVGDANNVEPATSGTGSARVAIASNEHTTIDPPLLRLTHTGPPA